MISILDPPTSKSDSDGPIPPFFISLLMGYLQIQAQLISSQSQYGPNPFQQMSNLKTHLPSPPIPANIN
jgi:hypothetical protein